MMFLENFHRMCDAFAAIFQGSEANVEGDDVLISPFKKKKTLCERRGAFCKNESYSEVSEGMSEQRPGFLCRTQLLLGCIPEQPATTGCGSYNH